MLDISLNENEINFKDLEVEIYRLACEEACKIMAQILMEIDDILLEKRDKKEYRCKGKKHTNIKTIMGTVEFDKRIYEHINSEGKKEYVYLLDEYLKMDTIGHISTNLIEKVVENVTEMPYREAAKNIESLTNQSISHTTAWNIIQKVGEKIAELEKRDIKLFKENKLRGEKETKILFQEMDGLWLSMQGKDRPKGKKSRGKEEIKLAVIYDGWVKRSPGSDEYITHNKIACAGFASSKEFKELVDATIAKEYNVDEIEIKIINGDGASWIKESLGEEGVYFQLDPFHKSQAVIKNVEDKKDARKLIKMLDEGKAEESLEYITKLMIEQKDDEKQMEKLEKLYNYLVANKEGITPYQKREEIKIPEAPEGIEYKHLGTMENNIFDILANRMNAGKMSWTEKGANNLAKILALKTSGKLNSVVEAYFNVTISEEKLAEIKEEIKLSAADVNKKQKKAKTYHIQRGGMPFEGCAMTNSRKAIREILRYKCLSELKVI